MLHIAAIWLGTEPMDMRAGPDAALARVVACSDRPAASCLPIHNRRASRLKILVYDGIGIWLAARRLHRNVLAGPAFTDDQLELHYR